MRMAVFRVILFLAMVGNCKKILQTTEIENPDFQDYPVLRYDQ
jgi:hypothetical protein